MKVKAKEINANSEYSYFHIVFNNNNEELATSKTFKSLKNLKRYCERIGWDLV